MDHITTEDQNTKITDSALAVASQKINAGVVAFENKKAQLEALAKEAKGLKIASISDKEGARIVSEKRKALKSERVEIEKQAKAMRDGLTQINRDISAKEKELIAIIEPTEKDLLAEEKRIEEEKERIRQEEITKENARIQKRIDDLAQFGFQIDYADVKSMSDETFAKYLDAAKIQHKKDQAEKAEQERLRLEQEEKERLEREAEAKRIAEEKAELERLRKEQEEREAKIRAEQEAMEAEKRKMEAERLALEEKKRKEEEDAKRAEELRVAKEKAAEAARIKAIEDAKEAERVKAEQDRKEREAAERKAARQPDKVKIQKYISDIKSVPVPELKTEDGKQVVASIQELISRFDSYATEKADQL